MHADTQNPAQPEQAPVPRHKFDALVAHAKHQDKLIADLQQKLNTIRFYDERDVWFWQGDGEDHLESLVCPIVIEAGQLRALVGCGDNEQVASSALVETLRAAERFICGFEGDPMQEGIGQLLDRIRPLLSYLEEVRSTSLQTAESIAARAEAETLRNELRIANENIEQLHDGLNQAVLGDSSGWYCAHCERGVDASEVTFHEQHTECGRVISDDQPPAAQQQKPSPKPVGVVVVKKDHISTRHQAVLYAGPIIEGLVEDGTRLYADPIESAVSAIKQPLDDLLGMFPLNIAGQGFAVNGGQRLRADGDDVFYSSKKVDLFLERIRNKATQARSAIPEFPPIDVPSSL